MVTRATDEIAHIQQRRIGQAVQGLHGLFGGSSRRRRDMGQAQGAGDIDAAMNAVDPGRAGKGNDNPGRAEDGQAALDAQARIEGLFRQRRAVIDTDLDNPIATGAGFGGDRLQHLCHHAARHRVDGGLAGRNGQAGQGDHADAQARLEDNAGTGRASGQRRPNQSAMCHIRVVASILDDSGHGGVWKQPGLGQGESDLLPARQANDRGVGEVTGQQRQGRRTRGGGGAGAGRPTASKRGRIHTPEPRGAVTASHGGEWR